MREAAVRLGVIAGSALRDLAERCVRIRDDRLHQAGRPLVEVGREVGAGSEGQNRIAEIADPLDRDILSGRVSHPSPAPGA